MERSDSISSLLKISMPAGISMGWQEVKQDTKVAAGATQIRRYCQVVWVQASARGCNGDLAEAREQLSSCTWSRPAAANPDGFAEQKPSYLRHQLFPLSSPFELLDRVEWQRPARARRERESLLPAPDDSRRHLYIR
jgi:hypothetical protein